MAQSRAVRESAPGECLMSDAGVSFCVSVFVLGVTLVGTVSVTVGGWDAAPVDFNMSRIGFTLDSIAGSFDKSSGFDKRAESRSPPPGVAVGVLLGDGGAPDEIFCRTDESISSCAASLARFSL